MPPRYAYWTILIDDKPTAFRAREREELQPTFVQLQRKNANVTMQWFARGKLWASREAERDDFQTQKHAASAPREPRGDGPPAPAQRRGSDWRPGGAHKDPRDRFKKKNRPERAWSEKDPATQRDRDKPGYAAKPRPEWRDKPVGPARGDRPWQKTNAAQGFRPGNPAWRDKPAGPPRGDRPWSNKPAGEGKRPWSGKPSDRSGAPRERKPWSDKPAPPSDRPWQTKPTGPRAQRKPWVGKPGPPGEGAGFKPRGDRPWTAKPPSGEKRPWSDRPPDRSGPPRERKPWSDKAPGGPPRGDRPWRDKPASDGKRPWSAKPPDRSGPPRERKPWEGKPAGGPPRGDRPWQDKSRDPRRSSAGSQSSKGGPGHRSSSDRPRSEGGWSGKPRDPNRKPFTPRGPRPGGAPGGSVPRKKRDDEE